MDNEHIPTAEELAAEQAALQPSKVEEVKAAVMAEFGFDEATDPALVEKMVNKELAYRNSLSTAIGQKIKHRDAAEALRKVTPLTKVDDKKVVAPEDIDKAVEAKLQKRDLDAVPASDALKNEISRVAEIQNCSIAKALKDPYIAAKLEQEKRDTEAADATINRKNRGSGSTKFDADTPPDVDMSTPEGRKEYKEWKDRAIKEGN